MLGRPVVSMDGKVTRGSHDDARAVPLLHPDQCLGVGSVRLVLGQRRVNDKSNEIMAISELLESLVVDGCDHDFRQAAVTRTGLFGSHAESE